MLAILVTREQLMKASCASRDKIRRKPCFIALLRCALLPFLGARFWYRGGNPAQKCPEPSLLAALASPACSIGRPHLIWCPFLVPHFWVPQVLNHRRPRGRAAEQRPCRGTPTPYRSIVGSGRLCFRRTSRGVLRGAPDGQAFCG